MGRVTNEDLPKQVRGQTVPTRFVETVRSAPDAVALRWKDGDAWRHWTWTDYAERADPARRPASRTSAWAGATGSC